MMQTADKENVQQQAPKLSVKDRLVARTAAAAKSTSRPATPPRPLAAAQQQEQQQQPPPAAAENQESLAATATEHSATSAPVVAPQQQQQAPKPRPKAESFTISPPRRRQPSAKPAAKKTETFTISPPRPTPAAKKPKSQPPLHVQQQQQKQQLDRREPSPDTIIAAHNAAQMMQQQQHRLEDQSFPGAIAQFLWFVIVQIFNIISWPYYTILRLSRQGYSIPVVLMGVVLCAIAMVQINRNFWGWVYDDPYYYRKQVSMN